MMTRTMKHLPLSSIRRLITVGLVGLLWAGTAHAQAPLLPDAFPQYLSSTGAPLAGGSLTFDAAGTTTPQTVYSDATLTTPLANPYTLDAAGRPPLGIYLSAVAYKIILKDSTGTTIRTQDNVYGATYLASLAVAPSVQTTTSTGTVNDFVTASLTSNLIVLRCNNASDLTLTGFTAATTAGQQLLIISVGAGNVFLPHQNTGSAAANREINFATSGSTPLASASGIAKYAYDTTTSRWRLLLHEQGAWITGGTPTIVGNGAMTISGISSAGFKYRLSGRTLSVTYDVAFTVGGTPSTQPRITIPAGFTTSAHSWFVGRVLDVTAKGSLVLIDPSTPTQIDCYNDFTQTGIWTAGSASAVGTIAFEVQ